ncbi:MAG: DUF1801 domain-containing protein [Ginsengibacter sp.]
MLTASDNFYLQKEEPVKGCLLALRDIILSQDKEISGAWKYGMPFFCFRGRMFCYLWVHKKYQQPYLGIVEGKRFDHPGLVSEKRSRMKIMLFDPDKDLPLNTIRAILKKAIDLYKPGEIKLKS